MHRIGLAGSIRFGSEGGIIFLNRSAAFMDKEKAGRRKGRELGRRIEGFADLAIFEDNREE
jgi:hypothetical protein